MKPRRRSEDDHAGYFAVVGPTGIMRPNHHPTATVPKPLADLMHRALQRVAAVQGERTPLYVREAIELYERELGRRG